jgi:hypothetical protein
LRETPKWDEDRAGLPTRSARQFAGGSGAGSGPAAMDRFDDFTRSMGKRVWAFERENAES